MSEYVKDLLQTVSTLGKEWRVDDVRSDVDESVHVSGADVRHFFVLAVVRVVVDVEKSPVKHVIRDRDLDLILKDGKPLHHFRALLDLLNFLV